MGTYSFEEVQPAGNSENFCSLFQASKNTVLLARLKNDSSSDWQVSFVFSYWPPREKMKLYFTSTF